MKTKYFVDNYDSTFNAELSIETLKKYCIKDRKGNLLFIGTLPECHAWVSLMDGGYFDR